LAGSQVWAWLDGSQAISAKRVSPADLKVFKVIVVRKEV
jgi:hypothetical protein